MVELLTAYTFKDIVIFIVMLAVAMKGVFVFCEWAYEKGMNFFEKQTRVQKEKERVDNIDKKLAEYDLILKELSEKMDILVNSDRDDIKSYIVEKHHFFCYDQKWIDDFSLDSIEKRYVHYKEENGNSYVSNLMKEVRALPKRAISE